MSTADETTKMDPAGGEGALPDKNAENWGPVMLFFLVGFALSLVVGWVLFPKLLYSQKKQPVDFNHKLHMEMDEIEDCSSCHYFREDGSFSGAPKLAQCTDCHDSILSGTENELVFYEEYVQKEREIPWLIYSKQPQCVYFSHVAHVKMANMDCKTCHGDIGESETLPIYQQNRISLYSRDIWGHNIAGFATNTWDRMKMDDCARCQVREGVRQASVQTHKGGWFVCHH